MVLAAIGAVVWTVIDTRRQRSAYPRLAAAMMVVLRYYLAAVHDLVRGREGAAAAVPTAVGRPLRRGDRRHVPDGPSVDIHGHSGPYTFIAGLAEIVGAVLLLWRRTTLIGALLLAGVLVNIVLLNFCYDVPVKLFSVELCS